MTNIQDMTIGQLLKSVKNLKYSTIAFVFGVLLTIISVSFAIGRYSVAKSSAVMLESPFAMRINLNNVDHDFNSLTLIRDPSLPTISEDEVTLSLREIRSAFDIIQVGVVVAKIENGDVGNIWRLFSVSLLPVIESTAHAQPTAFNWYGHENKTDFTEKFVSVDTINRKYPDGCILEYKVDANRRSIPSSFTWIKINH